MKIVLDTNVIIGNWLLEGPNFLLLESFLRNTTSALVVPKIVVEEVLSRHRSGLKSSLGELRRLVGRSAPEIRGLDVAKLSTEYESRLRERLRQLGAEIPEYDDIPVAVVASRAVKHLKPFPKDGDKGFKDALIWETILRKVAAREDHTVLISRDRKAFGKKVLAPDLRRDLSEAGLPEDCVEVMSSIKSYNDKYARRELEILEDVCARLQATGRFEWFIISEFFAEQREEIVERVQEFSDQLVKDEDKEAPRVVWLEDPQEVGVLEVLGMDEGRAFVRCQVTCGASIDFYVPRWSGWMPGPTTSFIVHREWNKDYSFASEATTLDIVLSIAIDLREKKVDSYEVEDVTRPDECRYCGGRISDGAEECPHCGESFF